MKVVMTGELLDRSQFDVVVKAHDDVEINAIYEDDGRQWERISSYIQDRILELNRDPKTTTVLLDMKEVYVSKPWTTLEFMNLFRDYDLYLVFKNDKDKAKKIGLVLRSVRDGSDRAFNEVVRTGLEVEKTVYEDPSIKEVKDLIIKGEEEGVYELHLSAYLSNLSNSTNANIIKRAIVGFMEEVKPKKFIFDTDGVQVLENVISDLKDMVEKGNELCQDGFEFRTPSEYLRGKMEMAAKYRHVDEVSVDERMAVFGKMKDFPAIYIEYKMGKRKDRFGRLGEGEIDRARPCIIRECVGGRLKIESYSNVDGSFRPWFHSYIELGGDDEEPSPIKSFQSVVDVVDVGYEEQFLGRKFHIERAIQSSLDNEGGVTSIYRDNGKGASYLVDLTIPELMKETFDSWGIIYDEEEMSECIAKTNELIK
jgi:hypothetical protein